MKLAAGNTEVVSSSHNFARKNIQRFSFAHSEQITDQASEEPNHRTAPATEQEKSGMKKKAPALTRITSAQD
jgi:hypothetical protein